VKNADETLGASAGAEAEEWSSGTGHGWLSAKSEEDADLETSVVGEPTLDLESLDMPPLPLTDEGATIAEVLVEMSVEVVADPERQGQGALDGSPPFLPRRRRSILPMLIQTTNPMRSTSSRQTSTSAGSASTTRFGCTCGKSAECPC
jgi:hypothetical protein